MASKLTKKINSRFNPTLLSGYPIYTYGGLMKKYAGGGFMIPTDLQQEFIKQGTENTNLANLGLNIADTMGETIAGISNTARPNKPNYGANIGAGALKGTAQGAAIGSIVPGVGTLIGGAIGGISGTISGLGKSIVKDQEIKQQEEVEKQGRIDTLKKQMISNLPAQHYYQPTFAMGGKMYPDGGEVDAISGAAPKYWQIPIKERDDFKGNLLSKFANNAAGEVGFLPTDASKFVNKSAGANRKGAYDKVYDLYNYYFGQPLESNILKYSKYSPSISSNKDSKYISIKDKEFINQILDIANKNNIPENNSIPVSGYIGDYKKGMREDSFFGMGNENDWVEGRKNRGLTNAIGRFRLGRGKDNNGEYISYYDIFDAKSGNEYFPTFGTAKPYEIYDRIYIDKDSTGRYVPREEFKYGGKISRSEIAKGTKEEMEHTSSKKVSRKTAMDHLKEDPKYYTKLKEAGLADAYAKGGMLNSYANGGNLDNTTVFQGGGSHQENQLGGIPQGTNALVEEGEVRFKDYIFSNRIPYTKKK